MTELVTGSAATAGRALVQAGPSADPLFVLSGGSAATAAAGCDRLRDRGLPPEGERLPHRLSGRVGLLLRVKSRYVIYHVREG